MTHLKFVILLLTILCSAFIVNAQWQRQTIDTKASFRGLSVVNQNVVWASGTGGTFIKTVDGGKNWTVGKVPEAEKLDFRDVEAFDANTAYLLSIGNGETSRIYKTIDGGKTWEKQFQATNKDIFLDAFAFWDKDHGIAMGDPVNGYFYLLRTDDGGKKWYPLSTDKMFPAKSGEAAFAASGTCIITQGKNNVFMVSGGNEARVFRSTNRGNSWLVSETPITKGTQGSGIFSIAMFDAKNGVIVGGNYEKPNEVNNNLAFTNDGGKTWTLGKGLNGYRSGATFMSDKQIIFAVGSNGSEWTFNKQKWNVIDQENYNSIQAKGADIWVVGANGLIATKHFNVDSVIIPAKK
ncbi:MAG TPA: YCF48-related protein [Pyrinomonadaceae bacterium]|nr:YCF48-related protein [Pyrinomonadaceae bacterium]